MSIEDEIKQWAYIHAVKTAGAYTHTILHAHGFIHTQEMHAMGSSPVYENKKVLICKRNPYDRVNSIFSFYSQRRIIPQNWTLKEFIMQMFEHSCFKKIWEVSPWDRKNKRPLTYGQLFSPLTNIAKDASGNIQADYILDFHNLDKSLSEFLSKFDIRHDPKDKININPKKNELDLSLWDREMLDKVNHIYSEDFEFFGYNKL